MAILDLGRRRQLVVEAARMTWPHQSNAPARPRAQVSNHTRAHAQAPLPGPSPKPSPLPPSHLPPFPPFPPPTLSPHRTQRCLIPVINIIVI